MIMIFLFFFLFFISKITLFGSVKCSGDRFRSYEVKKKYKLQPQIIIRFNLIIILSFTIILLYIFLKECYLDMSSVSSNTKTTGIFILNCNWGSGGWLKLERSNTDSNNTSLSPSNMNNAFVSTTSHIGDVKSSLNFKLIKRA